MPPLTKTQVRLMRAAEAKRRIEASAAIMGKETEK